jgi:hypothetical protein
MTRCGKAEDIRQPWGVGSQEVTLSGQDTASQRLDSCCFPVVLSSQGSGGIGLSWV